MNSRNNLPLPFSQSFVRASKQERSFELSLPALVSGLDAGGRKFKEKTMISSISSQFTSFHLKTRVTLGAILNLTLDIPKTFLLEKKMRMYLSGQVSRVQYNKNGQKDQLISLHLKNNYKIQPYFPS